MTELEKRIQRFRTNRPKGARRLCLALRAITEARAPEDRVKGYPVFPELEDVLDNIPTISSVGEALLNAEAKGFDIRELWRAMDDGLNWGIAKRMLRNAKRDFQNNSALSFKEHLAKNIANPARAHERADRGKKRKSRRALGSVPSITVPRAPSDGSTADHPRTAPRLAQVQQQLVEAAHAPGGADDMELKIYFNITANLAQRHKSTGATQPVTVSDAAEEAGTAPAKPAETEAKTRTRRLESRGQQARAGRVKTKESAKRKSGKRKRKQLTHDPDTGHKLPSLHLRIARAIGDRTVDIPTAITLLRAFNKKWVPRSKNLPRYFSLAMSTHEEVFEHLHRGLYRVRPSWFTENAPRVVESAAAA